MSRTKESIREAESYLSAAETQHQKAQQSGTWNPVIVNCIMAMIKSVDALMLEHRGETNEDHSKTSRELKKLYEDGLISDGFQIQPGLGQKMGRGRENLDTVPQQVSLSKRC